MNCVGLVKRAPTTLPPCLCAQEKALGPDHPDVIAIKDVLNSE